MSDTDLKKASVVVAAAAIAGNASSASERANVAGLAARLADSDIEVARAAKRELWRIVRHLGRPGAHSAKRAVVIQLEMLLKSAVQPTAVYREVLWMLSEIGTSDSVKAIAALLSNKVAREDARMALERIPGERSLDALKSALDVAPDDFKLNLAQSLRARGTQVPGLPCQKLKPAKQTNVTSRSETDN